MARIQLVSGAYTARSLISNAQRSVNLYAEVGAADSPALATHYPTPGTTTIAAATSSNCRCVYKASNGVLYVVEGGQVFVVDNAFTRTLLGTIPPGDNPVVMADNGLVIILVDGTPNNGWAINLAGNAFAQIVGDSFYGGTSVWYLDTYFLLNRPDPTATTTTISAQWYISLPDVTFADLTGGPAVDGVISGVGSGYADGTYAALPFTGGTPTTGMTADVTVTGGVVTDVAIVDGGGPYTVGQVLTTNLNGQIATATLAGGAGYVNGLYAEVPLTGGSGAGFTADITVDLGAVTAVSIVSAGAGYAVGDVLTSDIIGTGIGFTYTVDTISGSGSGFTWVISDIGLTGFDPLDFATKVDGADSIVNMIVSRGEVWLLGRQTSEVWFFNADPVFPFARVDSVFAQYGCNAPYSVASTDIQAVWLGRNSQGHCLVLEAASYEVKRISTHAIEYAISAYPNASILNAAAFVYQQEGHTFYVLNFPVIAGSFRGATWVYDFASMLWHERTWTDTDGLEWRHRVSDATFVYGVMVAGDWEDGRLYNWSLDTYTDDGGPIVRRRGFPHMVNDGKRASYAGFAADISVAQQAGLLSDEPPLISLRWSDTRGQTWGDPVRQSLGATGQYLTQPRWNRLGMARDRVFELFWDAPGGYAIQSAFLDAVPART
jgi:hypothetical protein